MASILCQTDGSERRRANQTGTGAFFRVIPYGLMVGLATLSFGYAVFAMGMGALRYWRGTAPGAAWP